MCYLFTHDLYMYEINQLYKLDILLFYREKNKTRKQIVKINK